jgi:hypothetical protein
VFLLFFWLLLLLFFCVPKGAPWSESGAFFLFDQISLFGADGVTLNNSQKTLTSTNCGIAEKAEAKTTTTTTHSVGKMVDFSRWLGGDREVSCRAKGEKCRFSSNYYYYTHIVSM